MEFISDLLHYAAHGDITYGTATAALLGVVFHLSIQSIEFEFFMYHFMVASALTFSSMTYALGPLRAVLFAGSFNCALLTSIAVYRLVLHRCGAFPGPFGVKISEFYAARLATKNVQYYKELRKCTNSMATLLEPVSAPCTHNSILEC
jgi:hypothetical protein